MTTAFLVPFLGHFVLVISLYALLTLRRMQAVQRGAARYDDYASVSGDTAEAARVRRNLANQFEAPLFAYFAALFLLWSGAVTAFDVAAAWVFLIGRLAHTGVQVLTDNVRMRGYVFTVNFAAVCALMGHVALIVLEGLLP